MVIEAIGITRDFPSELKIECEEAAVELTKAIACPDADARGFQMVISKAAHWINSQPQDPDDPNTSYGGLLGNAIFQRVTSSHTMPTVAACLAKFHAETKDLPFRARADAASVFVRVMFNAVAQDRQAMAVMSGTNAPHRFGARLDDMDTSLDDPVLSWPAWAGKVRGKFESMVELEWNMYCFRNSDPTFFEFLVSKEKPGGNRRVAKFFSGKENAALGYDLIGGRSGKGWLQPISESKCISFFTFKWSARADGDIDISRLRCIHARGSDVDAEEVIVPDVLSALDWDPSFGIDHLKQSLARILYKSSHASTFERGQASIVETVMKSMALHHNYKLAFSPAWSRPNPQPDQHALSEFNSRQFVVDALPHLMLTPT
ncbi:hypothetical protein SRS16CHR_02191 [Variovorax sp. SRS16]|nr:hypothetical protein SRS16CHR_02191 [Variovorax sp. SRS16]